ncbi:MAG: hypothetical protein HXM43_05265, partial [Lautropia mirabilis]|nr:hypothetical protein [Lautropia mirabilis]
TRPVAGLTFDDVIKMMVGRELGERFPEKTNKPHAARQISAQIRENPIRENPDRTVGHIIHGHPSIKTPGTCRVFTSPCPEN